MTISHSLLATALAAALSTASLSTASLPTGAFPGAVPPPVPPVPTVPAVSAAPAVPAVPAVPVPPVPPLPPLPEIAGQQPPAQEAPFAPATVDVPADLLDLEDWKLTLPTGDEGSPQEVLTGALSTFTNEFFRLNDSRNGVVFTAKVGGVTTQNSKYPRSELREMRDGEQASWSNPGGTHTLEVREAILATPKAKPEVVAAQIHDGDDDVLQIRLEGERLTAQSDDGETEQVLDPAYRLGTPYDLRIVAAEGRVEVFYSGEKKAELAKSGSGWYFKVGAYVQSSTEKGDAEGTPGAVAVYALKVTHTD